MIVHCETCKIGLLETESHRLALDLKDTHEFDNLHPVNLYTEYQGQRVRLAGMVGTVSVDI